MAMDAKRLQKFARKHACEVRTKGFSEHILQCQRPTNIVKFTPSCDGSQLKLAGFDDDFDWSDEPSTNVSSLTLSAVGAELRRSSTVKAITEMEVVLPLVRSIFEGRKKMILDAGHKTILSKKDRVGGSIQFPTKQAPEKDRECVGVESKNATLNKKVQVLDEEIAIFKKESKRVKNLAKEHEEGLTRLTREKAEWEQQKKNHMHAFQVHQDEQMENLKKEKQILDHRSVTLNIMPAIQQKEVEELKEAFAKEQEEHRGKEMRLRLTMNRLKAMNEDLTKQVLELQDEIRRYEGCLLFALDNRGNDLQTIPISKRPTGEANHKHAHIPPKQLPVEALQGGSNKSSKQCFIEESCDDLANVSVDKGEHYKTQSTSKFFSKQAKLLSDLFSHPWKVADCLVKEDITINRHQMGPKLADWR